MRVKIGVAEVPTVPVAVRRRWAACNSAVAEVVVRLPPTWRSKLPGVTAWPRATLPPAATERAVPPWRIEVPSRVSVVVTVRVAVPAVAVSGEWVALSEAAWMVRLSDAVSAALVRVRAPATRKVRLPAGTLTGPVTARAPADWTKLNEPAEPRLAPVRVVAVWLLR